MLMPKLRRHLRNVVGLRFQAGYDGIQDEADLSRWLNRATVVLIAARQHVEGGRIGTVDRRTRYNRMSALSAAVAEVKRVLERAGAL